MFREMAPYNGICRKLMFNLQLLYSNDDEWFSLGNVNTVRDLTWVSEAQMLPSVPAPRRLFSDPTQRRFWYRNQNRGFFMAVSVDIDG